MSERGKVARHNAEKHIVAACFSGRIAIASGDFFNDPLPGTDIITMGTISHALPPGSAFAALKR